MQGRRYIRTQIELQLQHLFGTCGPACQHDETYVKKSGSCVTCPVQQAQIRAVIEEKIYKRLDQTVLDGIGPVHTNRSESIGSVVARYRRKDQYHAPDVEFLKTIFGLLHCNTLALYRDGPSLHFVLLWVPYIRCTLTI